MSKRGSDRELLLGQYTSPAKQSAARGRGPRAVSKRAVTYKKHRKLFRSVGCGQGYNPPDFGREIGNLSALRQRVTYSANRASNG